jgi:hypothetical protein
MLQRAWEEVLVNLIEIISCGKRREIFRNPILKLREVCPLPAHRDCLLYPYRKKDRLYVPKHNRSVHHRNFRSAGAARNRDCCDSGYGSTTLGSWQHLPRSKISRYLLEPGGIEPQQRPQQMAGDA